ncbi:MAG: phytase [Opitutaceae bacterium]|nr:phytase [Opitutaceae bacterium]
MIKLPLKPFYLLLMTLLLQSCDHIAIQQSNEQNTPEIKAIAETDPSVGNNSNSAIIWINPLDSSKSLILTSDETIGIDILNLTGTRIGALHTGQIEALALKEGFPLSGQNVSLITALDTQTNSVQFYTLDPQAVSLNEITGSRITASFPTKGICLYQSPLDKNHYVFIVGEDGHMEQWVIYDNGAGKVDSRKIRPLKLGSEIGFCVADNRAGLLYVSEEANGIWAIPADPETDSTPSIVDIVKFGNITEEVAGLTLYQDNEGHNYLIASNASANSYNVYDINKDHNYLGSFTVPNVEETAGLYATSQPLNTKFPDGAVIISDDDNGDQSLNYKILSWKDIAQSLNLPAGTKEETLPGSSIKTVMPTLETTPVDSSGDAADDPAIWVHPEDANRSVIFGTDKRAGLYVYNLDGKVIQFLPDGRINNVDIRYGFPLGNEKIDIVTASNRTKKSISIYKVDKETGHLSNISDGIQDSGLADPYGFCMYHSKKTNKYYAFVNGDEGIVRQMELHGNDNGRISLSLVREFKVGSQTEGCVADDDNATFYIGEEDVALWKYNAEPDGGDKRTAVIHGTDLKNLEVDIEGVSLYYGAGDKGYIIISSQGNNSYAIFSREGRNEYLGSYAVVANGPLGIDGSSETDGLDVISTPLGDKFPFGLFIAQDGRNISPAERQNFKLVPWEHIADQFGLDKYTGWDPRN